MERLSKYKPFVTTKEKDVLIQILLISFLRLVWITVNTCLEYLYVNTSIVYLKVCWHMELICILASVSLAIDTELLLPQLAVVEEVVEMFRDVSSTLWHWLWVFDEFEESELPGKLVFMELTEWTEDWCSWWRAFDR